MNKNLETIKYAIINIKNKIQNSPLKEYLPDIDALEDFSNLIGHTSNLCQIYTFGQRMILKHELSQLKAFLTQLEAETLTNEEISKYVASKLTSKKAVSKELEKVFRIIISLEEERQSEILAKLYCNCIRKNITFEKFKTLSHIIKTLPLSDLDVLIFIFKEQPNHSDNFSYTSSAHRLSGLGLISPPSDFWISENNAQEEPMFKIFDDAKDLYNWGLS